jgi:hypothetical protein
VTNLRRFVLLRNRALRGPLSAQEPQAIAQVVGVAGGTAALVLAAAGRSGVVGSGVVPSARRHHPTVPHSTDGWTGRRYQ